MLDSKHPAASIQYRPSLTYSHTAGMVFHMKTTLNISDVVMKRLKEEAARQGKTMSEMVEGALRQMLDRPAETKKLPPLPTFDMGPFLVDISNREALYKAMEDYDARHRY